MLIYISCIALGILFAADQKENLTLQTPVLINGEMQTIKEHITTASRNENMRPLYRPYIRVYGAEPHDDNGGYSWDEYDKYMLDDKGFGWWKAEVCEIFTAPVLKYSDSIALEPMICVLLGLNKSKGAAHEKVFDKIRYNIEKNRFCDELKKIICPSLIKPLKSPLEIAEEKTKRKEEYREYLKKNGAIVPSVFVVQKNDDKLNNNSDFEWMDEE
jgi:hypothetical protein